MPWRRLGWGFLPEGKNSWSKSHAALPVAVPLDSEIVRIFFSTRAADSRSSVGWADVVLGADQKPEVIGVSKKPVLEPGSDGMFDDNGVGLGCIVESHGRHRLYYMGWNIGVRAPWRNSIGLAEGDFRAPSFTRYAQGPILDRSPEDPFTLSYPCVVRLEDGLWHMWYGSSTRWGSDKHADINHVIKHATSKDGIAWRREATPAFGFLDATEYAQARPSVLAEGQTLRLWFACRGEHYRIGCAVSDNGGRTWERADGVYGLQPGAETWENRMVCYPWVFRHDGRLWMAYNGNHYGATGFGLALWEESGP